jgi:hypothetical protein
VTGGLPQTLTFAPTESFKDVVFNICGDTIVEPTETVNLGLSSFTGAVAGTPASAVLSINDTATAYRNPTPILISLGSISSPYPSSILVSGAVPSVASMRVTLYDLSHDFPENIDVLLVGPNGAKYVLMGDVGGPFTISSANAVTLNFTDSAGVVLPDSSALFTGTYLPTTCETPVTSFPSAPAAPYAEPGCVVSRTPAQTLFGSFGTINPNGTWDLYVRDDNGAPFAPESVVGSIAGGWGIEFLPTDEGFVTPE